MLTAALTGHQMSKYYSLFINWVTGIISGYGGKVARILVMGCFSISFRDSDTKTIRNCLNSAITSSLLHRNVNTKFISESLPELNYRISLDYGEGSFTRTVD
jgi:hypothetical protein